MSVGIECPVCEAVFLVKQASDKTGIRCPECNRKFRYSEEVLTKNNLAKESPIKPAAEAAGKSKSSEQRSSAATESKAAAGNAVAVANQESAKVHKRSKKKSKWKTAATETPRLSTPKPVHDSNPKPIARTGGILDQLPANPKSNHLSGNFELDGVGAESEFDIAAIHARKKQKAKRQTLYATVAIAVLSISTIILGFVLYRQLNVPADELRASQKAAAEITKPIDDNASSPVPLASDPAPIDSTNDWPSTFANPEPVPEEDEQSIEPPRVLAANLPEREFKYLRKAELQKIWKRIRPRLISLSVRTDLGIQQSVGTMIDSRGWALTSNQLVSKWPNVSATASARNIDAYYADQDARSQTNDENNADETKDEQSVNGKAGQRLLTDIAKGIASNQPKRDQALLALNTRFVIALDKFEFVTRKSIVAGLYLVQAAPPSPANPYGLEEVKVLERQTFDELESEARDKAEFLGIDDPSATWVVTTKKANPFVGTPIFTRASKLVGTYAFSTKQFAYFVLTDQSPSLIAQAAQTGAGKGKIQQVDAEINLLSPSHLMARPSVLLNKAGVACEAFGWIPADTDQYKQLQKFSRRFTTVVKFVRDNQDDESDSVSLSILSDQITRWQRSLSQSISDSFTDTPENIFQMNVIAADKLAARRPTNNANTYIPFVAELYRRGIDEKTNQDTILMTIDDNRAVIKVPVSRQTGMKPGSLWLCFYQRPTPLTRSIVSLRSGQSVPLYYDGNLLTVLGPIKKR